MLQNTDQYRNRIRTESLEHQYGTQYGTLSPTELRVCALAELPNKEIAYLLGLSINTVRTHIQRALKKTGCGTRTALRILGVVRKHAESAYIRELRQKAVA